MSDEGSIPSGRAAPEHLENQQVTDRATGRTSSAWSGLGPKEGQRIRRKRGDGGWWAAEAVVLSVSDSGDSFHCGVFGLFWVRDRGVTWDFALEDLALMGDPSVTHGKNGVPVLLDGAPVEVLHDIGSGRAWYVANVARTRETGWDVRIAGVPVEVFVLFGDWGVRLRGPGAADPDLTAGKHGNLPLPAIPEPVRCRGLTEINHTWQCEAVLGPGEGDQCAHCKNAEERIRAEDLAVEETERRDAKQALAYEKLLMLHHGDARAVVAGVLRTLVAAKVVTAEAEHGVHASVTNVINQAFLHAKELDGLPLLMFWSLLADVTAAERNSLRRANAETYRGVA